MKKTMKKISWIVLAVIMLTLGSTLVSCSLWDKLEALPLQFTLREDGQSYSVGSPLYLTAGSVTEIIIPETYKGLPVTHIENGAFDGFYNLKSIVIPNTVTNIGKIAFLNCNSLTAITLPDGLTSIGDAAFEGCDSLADITLPDGLTSIGEGAFGDCVSLTSMMVPDSVTSIGDYAFADCENLANITLPDGLTTIEEGAFSGCVSLTGIIMPDSVTSIGDEAFDDCVRLKNIQFSNNITSIGEYAFMDCRRLTSLEFPESLVSIGRGAFSDCVNLIEATIPESVEKLGDGCFSNCSKLSIYNRSDIKINSNNGYRGALYAYTSEENRRHWTDSDGYVFFEDERGCILIGYTGEEKNITLPSSCQGKKYNIYEYAFAYCDTIESVTVPEGVEELFGEVFIGCHHLKNIILPKSLTHLGRDVFGYLEIDIFYCGNSQMWDRVHLNSYLTTATRYYYSETQPTDTENLYWHYVDGEPTVW